MKSKTLDIIGFYSLTGSAAYKVAAVKSFPLGQLIVLFQKNHLFQFFYTTNLSLHCFTGDDVCTFFYRIREEGGSGRPSSFSSFYDVTTYYASF